MKLFWNGYELEGTAQEITEFIKMNEPVTIFDSNKTRIGLDSSCNDCYKILVDIPTETLVDIPEIGPTDEDIKNLEILNKISRKAINEEMQ